MKKLFLLLCLINIFQYPLLGDGLAYWWPPMYRLFDGIVLSIHVISMSFLYIAILKKG